MVNTKPIMMGKRNLSLSISLILMLIVTSCSTSNAIQKEVKNIMESNDYTFVYMGTHWCQASINNFLNNYSNINKYDDKMGVVIIFFDNNNKIAYNEKIMKYSPMLFKSKGPLFDKIRMNNICDNLLKDYKREFKSPIYFLCNKDGVIIKNISFTKIEELMDE